MAPNLRIERLGENLGIAAALNIGLEAAVREGFDYVLLSDQESLPAPDMIAVLRDVAERLTAKGKRVGCVCPEYFDQNTAQAFPFQVQLPGRLFYSSVGGEQAKPWVEVLTTISSGSLLPCASWRKLALCARTSSSITSISNGATAHATWGTNCSGRR